MPLFLLLKMGEFLLELDSLAFLVPHLTFACIKLFANLGYFLLSIVVLPAYPLTSSLQLS